MKSEIRVDKTFEIYFETQRDGSYFGFFLFAKQARELAVLWPMRPQRLQGAFGSAIFRFFFEFLRTSKS